MESWARRAITAAAAGAILAGCSGPSPQPTITVTVPASPEPVVTSVDSSAATESVPVASEPAPTASVDPAAPAEPVQFTMPNVVGVNLQLAQDTLQALGSYLMDQTDATGLGRFQVDDSNWQVCSQDPAPGAVVPVETVVTLAAVKLSETCPG